jgi:hypothetical protein
MTAGHRSTTPDRAGRAGRALQPTAAELARTVAARGSSALHAVDIGCGPHLAATTTAAGQVLVVVPLSGTVAAAVRESPLGDLPARLTVTDTCPQVGRAPVRARLDLAGWLTPVRAEHQQEAVLAFADVAPCDVLLDVGLTATLLRLDVADVVVEGCGRRTEVSPEEYSAARPDPVALAEADVLAAADAHMTALLRRVRLWAGADDCVHLLGVDRYGVTFRVLSAGEFYDLRVPFAAELAGPADVPEAVRRLTLCPHTPA